MKKDDVTPPLRATFESIRQQDEAGDEFWSARALAPLLDYQDWQNFMQVVDRRGWPANSPARPWQTISVISPKWSTSALAHSAR